MTTLFRSIMHDGTRPVEVIADDQLDDMAHEANRAGKALANVTTIFDGTVAEARTVPEIAQYVSAFVGDYVEGRPNTPMLFLVQSADVVRPADGFHCRLVRMQGPGYRSHRRPGSLP